MIVNSNFAIFNGSNLALLVDGLTILAVDPYRAPKRTLTINSLARTDKRKTSAAFYKEKSITVTVGIQQGNRDAVERSIDSLNKLIQGIEKELLVPQSGGTRKYICTYADTVPRRDGGAYWEADLVFALSDYLFGSDTSYTQIANLTAQTSASRQDQYNWEGSAAWQLPHIEIYYTAVSGTNPSTVTITNLASGQGISITRNWTAGERLVIDAATESVQVNGVDVDFTGPIPKFAPGLGTLQYSDTLTSRTYNYFVYYYKRWV